MNKEVDQRRVTRFITRRLEHEIKELYGEDWTIHAKLIEAERVRLAKQAEQRRKARELWGTERVYSYYEDDDLTPVDSAARKEVPSLGVSCSGFYEPAFLNKE